MSVKFHAANDRYGLNNLINRMVSNGLSRVVILDLDCFIGSADPSVTAPGEVTVEERL